MLLSTFILENLRCRVQRRQHVYAIGHSDGTFKSN